ncbi:acyltransferase [Prevotella sp. HCN-7019]|uniref:acyltransferase n=1 Tax=Prevotella sp. HCN-7019 TaxID=3134668 RepID=UPI0030C55224
MRILINLIVMVLPWFLKKRILRTFYKYKIHDTAYIGLSYVYPIYLEMGEGASIGHFNVAIHLDSMILGKNSSISRSNWITGFPTGTKSKHFAHQKNRKSELMLGDESAITKKHHIDCTNSITIGKYTTIAGYNSQLLTHSIDIYEGRQDSHPIEIGDYCFVGTSVIVLGGSSLPSYSVLAAGSVLNKKYEDKYKLYAGVPAISRKDITCDAKYFNRGKGFVF